MDGMFTRKNIIIATVVAVVIVVAGLFFFSLDPADAAQAAPVVFTVNTGDGFMEIAQHLSAAHLVRSTFTFALFSLADGRAFEFKPGLYRLSPSMDAAQIVAALSGGGAGKVTVVIPEGSNIYGIDRILSNALVIRTGALVSLAGAQNLEGYLFPDTYQFYTNDKVGDVVQEMTSNFDTKAAPLFASVPADADPADASRTLIIASIVQVEVPDQQDQEIVAGIILKRLAEGMPLDIDATVCYAKLQADPASAAQPCSLGALDFKIDSPYNTYLYKGLPPTSIGNPGTSAITAALHPQSSPYLYYLSDPATGKTIFAKTLDEQNKNRVKYLESN
jgi:UPF0755 protein